MTRPAAGEEEATRAPTLSQAVPTWWRIGILSFGGPAAQIALMHKMVVDERQWLTERQFLDALSFCTLLPGPEAMQLATYAGWRMHGVRGGLVAGGLFVLPGAVLIGLLAALYVRFGDFAVTEALFLGVKAAVLVIVIEALSRVARRALHGWEPLLIAFAAFLALFAFAVPYPLVVVAAALWGAARLVDRSPAGATPGGEVTAPVSVRETVRTVIVWLAIWFVPLLAVSALAPNVFGDIARFFSVLATVTFGGAYAVLAYMTQEAVTTQQWLTTDEMLDALGLAETTPGPLILVTQFVGFLASYRAAEGAAMALVWGLAGALVTLWATFAPCFLWVFAGAPWIDRIARRPRLRAALTGVTAAVVGVIANLSVWFGLHVLFGTVEPTRAGPLWIVVPEIATFDWRSAMVAVVAALLLLRFHRSVPATLAACSLLGVGLLAISR